MSHSIVYITTRNANEANKIAKALLEKRLIACANIFPLKSIYRWRGNIEDAKEFGVFLKTRSKLVDRIIGEVKLIHSYDVPCVISFKIEKGNKDFLRWIEDETSFRQT